MSLKQTLLLLSASLLLGACTLPGTTPQNTNTDTTIQDNSASDAVMEDKSTDTMMDESADSMMDHTYSLEEVAAHDNQDDCWLVIDNKVYDVTDFVSNHPGGEAILQGCGIDATTLFNTRPMGSGTPHSDQARDNLSNFYIGDLSS